VEVWAEEQMENNATIVTELAAGGRRSIPRVVTVPRPGMGRHDRYLSVDALCRSTGLDRRLLSTDGDAFWAGNRF